MKPTFTDYPLHPLHELVSEADSGTWGDEAEIGEGQPVLRSTNIADGRLSLEEPAWRILSDSHRKKKRLIDGDIIVTSSSGSPDHIGKCAVFQTPPGNGKYYYFSNFTLRLRANGKSLHPKWLYYWLTSPRGRHEMFRLNNTTSGLRNLNKSAYLSQQVPLPKLDEQERIAAILDKADAIRRKRQELLPVVRDLMQTVFDKMFGQPVTNLHDWPVMRLEQVIAKGTSISYGIVQCGPEVEDGVPYIRTSDMTDETLGPIESFGRTAREIAAKFKRSTVRTGDLVFANRASIGAVVEVPDYLDGANLTQGTTRVSPGPKVHRHYLIWLFRTVQMQQWFDRAAKGATFREITMGRLRETPVPVPPMKLQQEFSRRFESVKKLSKDWELAAADADILFNALVQRAFKGEL